MAQLNLNGMSRDEQFAAASAFAGVPEAVARAQWQVESASGTHKTMVSEANAQGHFQHIPSTQAGIEARTGKKYNPFVFQDSLEMWAYTMKENMRFSKGDLNGAITRYHGGYIPANWGPRTREYVQKVTAIAYGDGGKAVNLPQEGYSWKGADIEAAWRGDAIQNLDQLRLEMARTRTAKEIEGTVLRGMRDETAAAVQGTENTGAMLDARRAVSAAGVQDALAKPQATPQIADTTLARAEADRAQQDLIDDAARREGWTFADKVATTWDTGPLGATWRALTSDIDYSTPEGWVYDPKQWEQADYNQEELNQIREASWNPSALAEAAGDIRQRRWTNQIISDMSPWEQTTAGLIGGFTDPVNAAASLLTAGTFNAFGVGSTSLAAAGRPFAALVSSGAEGATGSVLVNTGLNALGEKRTVGDYFVDGAFGVGFGLIAPYRGIMRTADEARLNALTQGLYGKGAEVRERVLADVQAAGGNLSTHQIDALVKQANDAEQRRWAEAGMQNVEDQDRLFARPDVGFDADERSAWDALSKEIDEGERVTGAPAPTPEPTVQPSIRYDADGRAIEQPQYEPPTEFSVERGTGNYKYNADTRVVEGWNASIRDSSVKPVLDAIAALPDLRSDFRLLAAKLARITDQSGLKPDRMQLLTRYGMNKQGTGGAYFPNEHALSAKRLTPDIILHEAIHAFSVREFADGGEHATRMKTLLDHVNAQLPLVSPDVMTPNMQFRANGKGASTPFQDIDELLAYGMTDNATQALLREMPAPDTSLGAPNAWEWLKMAVARVLGLGDNERSALSELLDVGTAALDSFTTDLDPNATGAPALRRPRAAGTAPASPVSQSRIRNKAVRDRIFGTYGLKDKVSDAATRLQMGEFLARSEEIVGRYNIDENKLKTMLERVGLESDSAILLASPNPAVRALGLMLAEHGEGAGGRLNFNAAVDLKSRYQAYVGTVPREYRIAFNTWKSQQGIGGIKAKLGLDRSEAAFNKQLNWYRENIYLGKELDVHPAVKAASDALDRAYNRMAADQRTAKVVGFASLPEEFVRGYGHRFWNGEAIKTVNNTRRAALVGVVREQLAERMEFEGDEFLDKLSRLYFERISERTIGLYRSPGRITNFNNADILRDSLKAMGMEEADIQKNLNRFTRGGAGHTRGRFDLDVTKRYTDKDGTFTLHDYLDQDVMGKFSRYANRVSGEVSAARFGIMGDAGIDVVLKTLDATNAPRKEVEAVARVLDRYVGRASGPQNPDLMQTISNASSAAMMGGGIWNQLGEYLNAIPTVGLGGVADALKLGPQLTRDIMAKLRGEVVEDSILDGLEAVGGVRIGLGEFDMYAGPNYMQENMLYGPEGPGILTTLTGRAAHNQQLWSGQILARAVQTRGLTKVLVEKVMTSLQHGKRGEMGKALRDIGLDDDLLDMLEETIGDVAEFNADGTLRSFDPRKADTKYDAQYVNFYNALNRGANQMIQGEFVGETGAWASKPLLRFMLKFRTFSLIAHQKQLGRYAGLYGAGGAAAIMVAGMGLAIPLYAARTMLTAALMPEEAREEFLKERFSPLAIGRATMNYVAASGMLPDVADLTTGAAGGWYEAAMDEQLPQWARPTGGRTLAREDAIGGILGPGVAWANDVVQAAGGNLDAGMSALPFGRMPAALPFIQGLRTHIREGKDDNDIY